MKRERDEANEEQRSQGEVTQHAVFAGEWYCYLCGLHVNQFKGSECHPSKLKRTE